MKINGKVHCFFEQSGTFKNEFKKLGIPAEDYDIQNNFGETDNVIDLFGEITRAYDGGVSIFDNISKDDLIMAFFPCIYFECLSMMAFSWCYRNYRKLTLAEATDKIIERENNRHEFYVLLLKLLKIVTERGLRMILENPWSMQHYLKQGNFVKNPDVVDTNRLKRGDKFVKPTAYWFFGCEPTHGMTVQIGVKNDKDILHCKKGARAGMCSEERSMITHDYARNFICDFILGKPFGTVPQQTDLFDALGADAGRRNEEAERKRLIAWYNERRLMCKCRCATGHCSPIHPKCRFYDKGMCSEIKEIK